MKTYKVLFIVEVVTHTGLTIRFFSCFLPMMDLYFYVLDMVYISL